MEKDHIHFMRKALEEAKYAFYKNEVPVGCVIVNENEIISRSSNMVELLNDSTAHAELIAITSAQNSINNKNLDGCILYTTLEPCLMCHGAIYWSKINTIVYGASDEKRGFSRHNLEIDRKINIVKGVMEEESRELLENFFKKIRG
ncbi:nucleoside deaminase [Flavobacteriaceae bacterium]|jgi:tRNA(adenine34) deaminase|nr:nucleoside deaminase [Cryomorphaceae bacterium]MDA9658656.1 nucleoside deaminase [Flavobacteriaceae bacterium]MBT3684663.1 nucleoside deaminase [Cryomorphaceae bacterium]MBT4237754.1 nucleoside deaminase [Cryomorphaceae bacterium]MBT5416382.1 nucleoside deaminase [Cryomorphaceae bacterium]|tara:strand:- start:263 stop:700 length:438 start_codon:yes stop_codon:yes gene_type:complete